MSLTTISGIVLSFCDGLISLSIMFSRIIHVVACDRIPFLSLSHSALYFIHLSVNRHLGCSIFSLWWMLLCMCVCKYLWDIWETFFFFFQLLAKYSEVDVFNFLKHICTLYFNFLPHVADIEIISFDLTTNLVEMHCEPKSACFSFPSLMKF